MTLTESALIEYLLNSNGIVRSNIIAEQFSTSRHDVKMMLSGMGKKGLVEYMRKSIYRVDIEAVEQFKRVGCSDCDECVMCYVDG